MKTKTIRILVSLPAPLRLELERLRSEGYTASGYIRGLIERDMQRRRMAGDLQSPRAHKGGAR